MEMKMEIEMKNKKVFFLIVILISIVTPLVLAQDSIKFNPGDLVNITGVRCLQINNTICDADISCNITIINDTQDFLYSNASMVILNNGFRNFDAGYAPNYTTTWSSVVDCQNGGIEEFIIDIGETKTDWETAFIIGMVGLISLFALCGYYIFDKEYWLIKSFLYFSSFGMLLVLINSAKIIAVGSASDKILTVGFTIAIVSLSIMFLYLFVFFFIEIVKSFKEKKGVRWRF